MVQYGTRVDGLDYVARSSIQSPKADSTTGTSTDTSMVKVSYGSIRESGVTAMPTQRLKTTVPPTRGLCPSRDPAPGNPNDTRILQCLQK